MHRRLERAVRPELRLWSAPGRRRIRILVDSSRPRRSTLLRARAWRRRHTALLIAGHGTERHRGVGRHRAPPCRARSPRRRLFAEVAVGFLDEPPRVPEALAAPERGAIAWRSGCSSMPASTARRTSRHCSRRLAIAAYAGPIGPDPADHRADSRPGPRRARSEHRSLIMAAPGSRLSEAASGSRPMTIGCRWSRLA